MAEILTLGEARLALRKTASDTSSDADLTATYIPATTLLVEGIIGPVMARTGLTATFNGGQLSMQLPSPVTAVTAVTVGGSAVTTFTTALSSGLVYGSYNGYAARFLPGYQNVVVTYNVGAYALPTDVPVSIKLAARIILAHLWQVDQQGFRPAFNGPDMDMTPIGIGYAIPRRAAELLAPRVAALGFA